MPHLIFDGDSILYKAGFVAERKEYDILPKVLPVEIKEVISQPYIGNEEREAYQMYLVGTFKTVEAYTEWLAINGYCPDDFTRVARGILEPIALAYNVLDSIMITTIKAVQPEQVTVLLGGDTNFREDIAKVRPYKENRKDRAKPVYFDQLKQYMIDKWHAQVVDNCEAEDTACIMLHEAEAEGYPMVIARIDKDLDQIYGWHYNYDTKKWKHINKQAAIRNLYAQIMAGDPTDAIPGVHKIGLPTAKKLLAKVRKPSAMWAKCLEQYKQDKKYAETYKTRTPEDVAIEMARLVYLQQHPGQLWSPPTT